jgi:hypothetical protein
MNSKLKLFSNINVKALVEQDSKLITAFVVKGRMLPFFTMK